MKRHSRLIFLLAVFSLIINISVVQANTGLLQPEVMKEDLQYLEKIILDVHPAPYHFYSKKEFAEKWQYFYQLIEEPLTYDEFYFIVLEAMNLLKDAHSTPYYGRRTIVLPLNLSWLSEGLYVKEDRGLVKRGDRVVALGELSTEVILEWLADIIPAENEHWVRYNGEEYIVRRVYLERLGLVNKDNTVTVHLMNPNGELRVVDLPFVEREWRETPDYYYSIFPDNNLAVFTLNSCTYDEGYRQILQKFFQEVSKHSISRVAIDVRDNTGGHSLVIDEFLTYTTVKNYRSYIGKIRYSSHAVKQNGIIPVVLSNLFSYNRAKVKSKPGGLYDGELYVLTSQKTFSSANWFAVVFQDNQIGKIVGEPTGNQPSSYGYGLYFNLPNTQMYIQLSHVKWIRPDQSKDPINTVEPDIFIPMTGEDIYLNRDPILEWFFTGQ